MGNHTWDPTTYANNVGAAHASGASFAYSSSIKSGTTRAATNPLLDPTTKAGPTSTLAGTTVREARDGDDHPNSLPIMVAFDQTGSMQEVPIFLVGKLPELFNLVLLKGYAEDPQFSFGAYGDAAQHETSPLQIGQFESDNRADETLNALYLEGRGGGNRGETAALVWYYAAKHTATDAWEKRGVKGMLFTIGDEVTFGVTPEMVKQYITPDHGMQAEMTPAEVYALASERWDVFQIIINNSTASQQQSLRFYSDFMGKNAVLLEDPDNVCETIAVLIGLREGTIGLDDGLADLDDIGAGAAKGVVGKALAKFGGTAGGAVAVADTPTDLLDDADSGVSRL